MHYDLATPYGIYTLRNGHPKEYSMALATKLWQGRLLDYFQESLRERVFTHQRLGLLLEALREPLELPASLRLTRFISVLQEHGQLKALEIKPEPRSTSRPRPGSDEGASVGYRPFARYIWGDASPFEVALSLRKGSYLSHASAVFAHGLTQQIARTVYVNKEQTPKPSPKGSLVQARIDQAFRGLPRQSHYIFTYKDTRLVLLNGKHTGNLEVSEMAGREGQTFPVTKLERTLIDITVRPMYAGGVFEVMEAFRGARERASVATMIATLKRLEYVYPYHQALGFYCERAGFPAGPLERFGALGAEYDFYLANKMPSPQYDQRWRIYYPQGL